MKLALVGGALIGLGAALLWFANGRIAGISGLFHNALRGEGRARWVSIAFLLGLVSAGAVFGSRGSAGSGSAAQLGALSLAGVLAGFGARLGGGCTSGHGVCGVARLSRRSIVATLTFMSTGALTVFVTRHVFPWLGAP